MTTYTATPASIADDARPAVSSGEPSHSRGAPADAALLGATGLTLIAAGFALSRTGHSGKLATAVFWLGFLVVMAPIAWRLLSPETSRRDRLMLVGLAAAISYAIKVLHDPLMFVMGDEFVHLAAAQHLSSAQAFAHLFADQSANVAVDYPGLQLITLTIQHVSGLSLFVSGLIVIGMARMLIMLAVFTVVDRLSGSPRAAGLAALLFVANTNFLFWSAQFSYESLALPLFTVALALLIVRAQDPRLRAGTTAAILVVGAAMTVTHHVTSFAFVIVLWTLTLLSRHRPWRAYRVTGLAAAGTVAVVGWVIVVAPETPNYLGYVFRRTVTGVSSALSGGPARTPFATNSRVGLQAPPLEMGISYAGVALLAVAVILTLLHFRRLRLLQSPFHILITAGALVFLALYAARLSSGSWETANRGQEFLFIAPAMLLALAMVNILGPGRPRRSRRGLLLGAMLLVIVGGTILGWPASLRLSQPLEVRVGTATLRPQGLLDTQWAVTELGTGATYMADEASGRELLVRGALQTDFGSGGGAPSILHDALLAPWERTLLRSETVAYAILDRRQVSTDPQAGYYFTTLADPAAGRGYYSQAIQSKFASMPMVSTLIDSGDIKLYDLRPIWQRPPPCGLVGLRSASTGVTCTAGNERFQFAAPTDRSVTFRRSRVRYLGRDVLRGSGRELLVSVRLQIQNLGSRPLRPDPSRKMIYLRVAGHRIARLRRVRFRTDDLAGRGKIAPGTSVLGSATYAIVGRREIRAFHRSGALVYVGSGVAPGATSTGSTAVFAVRGR